MYMYLANHDFHKNDLNSAMSCSFSRGFPVARDLDTTLLAEILDPPLVLVICPEQVGHCIWESSR